VGRRDHRLVELGGRPQLLKKKLVGGREVDTEALVELADQDGKENSDILLSRRADIARAFQRLRLALRQVDRAAGHLLEAEELQRDVAIEREF
jgi:hypothetical protein